jgi:hypothetical protein
MLPWGCCLPDGKILVLHMNILDHDHGIILWWYDIAGVHSQCMVKRERALLACSFGLFTDDRDTIHCGKVYFGYRVPGKDRFRSHPPDRFE